MERTVAPLIRQTPSTCRTLDEFTVFCREGLFKRITPDRRAQTQCFAVRPDTEQGGRPVREDQFDPTRLKINSALINVVESSDHTIVFPVSAASLSLTPSVVIAWRLQ